MVVALPDHLIVFLDTLYGLFAVHHYKTNDKMCSKNYLGNDWMPLL